MRPELGGIEGRLRKALYQWEHFQVDRVIEPVFRVRRQFRSTGIGLRVQETRIQGDTGAYISSHEYVDQLSTDEDLAKLRTPEITCDRQATEDALTLTRKIFDGLMPVELAGVLPSYNIWDVIASSAA